MAGANYILNSLQRLSLKVCVILIILSLFLSVQKVPTLHELMSLQLVGRSTFQADLGNEGLESAAGQIYKPLIFNGIVNNFTGVYRKITGLIIVFFNHLLVIKAAIVSDSEACSEKCQPIRAAFLSFQASFSSLSWFSSLQLFWFTLTVLISSILAVGDCFQ